MKGDKKREAMLAAYCAQYRADYGDTEMTTSSLATALVTAAIEVMARSKDYTGADTKLVYLERWARRMAGELLSERFGGP